MNDGSINFRIYTDSSVGCYVNTIYDFSRTLEVMMNKPAAFIVVENGQTWLRTSAETEEAIRTGFIMETVPLYTAPPKREPLSTDTMLRLITEHRDFPLNLVRAVEKEHGIGVDDD